MEMVCPVCGRKRNDELTRTVSYQQYGGDHIEKERNDSGQGKEACPQCGFAYAYVKHFANEKSLEVWKTKIAEWKNRVRSYKAEYFSTRNRFLLSSDAVSFISGAENKLFVFGGESLFEEVKNVKQYSRSERNRAFLFVDGRIEVQGDNSYGQCDTGDIVSAASVLCSPNATYVVSENGKVQVFGAVMDEKVKEWEDITALASGSFHLLGLTKDKKVKIAGEMIEKSVMEKISGWRNVKSVCAATDCSIALLEDGTVSFAGRQNDSRSEAEKWKDIVDIKVDSAYAVGLTKEGKVKLAGACKAYLDMNRASAANWENVVAIICSKSGIAAIFEDGSLKIVGNFAGDTEKICEDWKQISANIG